MKAWVAALMVTTVLGGVARAADRPENGPPPAWVKPVAIPPDTGPDTGEATDAPIRILLSDQQAMLEPGKVTLYNDFAIKFQTPQGLAAGNVAFAWRPDTDTVTVSRVVIRRGDRVIDVLAGGQTFTVLRREQNLDNAMLDGVLTATLQPEGLQVGDVLELVYTQSSSDPVLRGHVEQIAGTWTGLPVGRAHLKLQWPESVPLHVRESGVLPPLKQTTAGGMRIAELSADNLAPVVLPKLAPKRFAIGRMVEATDYASWAELGALLAPLYQKAGTLPDKGPLRAEFDKIAALPDAKARTQAALSLVQDKVRYVALVMGAGGYVPADAETTWSRRFGDCKGKTALLLALLHGLGIAAEPVIVSTQLGDGLDRRMPMIGLFDHVLVRATVDGKVYWLDGTRTGDTSLDRIAVPGFGWGLPLAPQGAALVRMVSAPLDSPTEDTTISIDASAGLTAPAPAKVEKILRGDGAIGTNIALSAMVGDVRENALKSYWKDQYDFIAPKTVGSSFDPASGELKLTMAGDAKMNWAGGSYETDGTSIGFKADFSRDKGPNSDAPFAVGYPNYGRTRETIVLPKNAGDFRLSDGIEVDETVGGVAYRRHASISGNTFTIERSERSLVPEIPFADAPKAQARLRALYDLSAKVLMPTAIAATGATAGGDAGADTAWAHCQRGFALFSSGKPKEALAELDQAVALDPTLVEALSYRATVRTQSGDLAGARADLARSDALDSTAPGGLMAHGMLADIEGDPKAAIGYYTRLLATGQNAFVLGRRAAAYHRAGMLDEALADADAVLKLNPTDPWAGPLRAMILFDKGDRDKAVAQLKAVSAAGPDNLELHVMAGLAYGGAGMNAEAVGELDRAIALHPEVRSYVARSRYRPADDWAGRQADIDAALKLDPQSTMALEAQAELQRLQGKQDDAIASFGRILAISPGNIDALRGRAELYRVAGKYDLALADTVTGLKRAPRTTALYLLRANIFRSQGKADEAVAQAAAAEAAAPDETYAHVVAANIYATFHKNAEEMAAFDRALAVRPEAYIYVNRALRRPKADVAGRKADFEAALRLDPDEADAIAGLAKMQSDAGDYRGALATYSAALARTPDEVDLLVGRGIAYARSGDTAKADADFALARTKVTDPTGLNNMCWTKAQAGVALDSALADCDEAIRLLGPEPPIVDSRAFVLLRLGRVDESIAEYDRAVGKSARHAKSLFGRAVAWSRKGDKAKAAADAAAALALDPDVRDDFADWGVTM